jgi:hypothetical protein
MTYMDICYDSVVGEMSITSPLGEDFDPADRIEEEWPMAPIEPGLCAGVRTQDLCNRFKKVGGLQGNVKTSTLTR